MRSKRMGVCFCCRARTSLYDSARMVYNAHRIFHEYVVVLLLLRLHILYVRSSLSLYFYVPRLWNVS
jgi:hypothetical protein